MSDDWAQDAMNSFNPDNGFGADDGEFGFDTGGVDADDIDGSGRVHISHEGFYHLELDAVAKFAKQDDKGELASPHVLVIGENLLDANGEGRGSIIMHRLYLASKGGGAPKPGTIKSTLNFLVGCGVLKKVDGKVIDPTTGTTKINTATLADRLRGMQIIGRITLEAFQEDEGKADARKRATFPFGRGAFKIDDPSVHHVPKNLEALKAIGKEHAMPGAELPKQPPVDQKREAVGSTAGASPGQQSSGVIPADL